jgi:hypothetical protein
VKLPELFVYFVDRSLGGRIVVDALRAAGETAHAHDEHFAADTPDADWLSEVGKRGWVVLTKDKEIRRNQLEHRSGRAPPRAHEPDAPRHRLRRRPRRHALADGRGAREGRRHHVDRASLDEGEFKAQAGGFARLDKQFDGRLDEILSDLRDALWRAS